MKTEKLERFFIVRADQVEARIDLTRIFVGQASRFPVGIVDATDGRVNVVNILATYVNGVRRRRSRLMDLIRHESTLTGSKPFWGRGRSHARKAPHLRRIIRYPPSWRSWPRTRRSASAPPASTSPTCRASPPGSTNATRRPSWRRPPATCASTRPISVCGRSQHRSTPRWPACAGSRTGSTTRSG